jgi:O-antigen/teichoic acid export membrane protein
MWSILQPATLRRLLSGRFGRDVLWNLASLVVLAIGGVVMNMLLVALRGEVALGVFNQMFALYLVISQLGVGGLQHSTLKHVSYAQDNLTLVGDITLAALLIITLISLPLLILVWFVAPTFGTLLQSPDVGVGLRFAIPGLFFFALNKALINVLNGLRNMRAYAVFQAMRYVLLPIFLIGIIWLDYGNAVLGFALTLTEIILFIALMVYIYMYPQLIPLRRVENLRARLSEHLSYGIRGFLSGVLNQTNSRIDVLMLGYFTGDATVGIYSFAATVAQGFSLLPVAVRNNLSPLIGKHFNENDLVAIELLAHRIKRWVMLFMVVVGVFAIAGYPILLMMINGDSLITSWGVFTILVVALVIGSGYRAFFNLLLQGGRPGTHTWLIVISVTSNILLNIALIPVLGIYGAAIATGIVQILDAAMLAYLTHRIWNIQL